MGDLSMLSLNTATAKYASLAECASACAEAGLGWIGPWRNRIQEVGSADAAKIISAVGLSVSTVCRGGFITATEPDSRSRAIVENTRAIEEAEALGARELVMVVGGLPAGDKNLVSARERVAQRLGDLVPIAHNHGVRLALEPMHPLFTADRGVLTTIGQSLDIAEQFEPEEVGVVIDTYHIWWDPDAHESIERAGHQGRISTYQICDWILPLTANTLNSRGLPGDGYIDFPTITRWVSEAGYTGPVEVEIFNENLWIQPVHQIVDAISARYVDLVEPYL